MNHVVWSNSLLLGAMLFVLGGLKFIGSTSLQGRKIGAGMVGLTAVFVMATSGRHFEREEPVLAAIALLVFGTVWWWTISSKRNPRR